MRSLLKLFAVTWPILACPTQHCAMRRTEAENDRVGCSIIITYITYKQLLWIQFADISWNLRQRAIENESRIAKCKSRFSFIRMVQTILINGWPSSDSANLNARTYCVTSHLRNLLVEIYLLLLPNDSAFARPDSTASMNSSNNVNANATSLYSFRQIWSNFSHWDTDLGKAHIWDPFLIYLG